MTAQGPAGKPLAELSTVEYRAYERAFNAALGRNIRLAREQRSWSRRHLSRVSGLLAPTVSHLERGACARIEHVLRVAEALGVEPTALLPPLWTA